MTEVLGEEKNVNEAAADNGLNPSPCSSGGQRGTHSTLHLARGAPLAQEAEPFVEDVEEHAWGGDGDLRAAGGANVVEEVGGARENERVREDYDRICIMLDNILVQKRKREIKGAIKKALAAALQGSGTAYAIMPMASKSDLCLQAVDYYSWAMYRKWESGDPGQLARLSIEPLETGNDHDSYCIISRIALDYAL